MSSKLIAILEKKVATIDWPNDTDATEQGRVTYMMGIERANDYHSSHDPKILLDALNIVIHSGSRPYAYAGVAYIFITASRQVDKTFALSGLTQATFWIEKAQQDTEDNNSINVLEAFIYIYKNELENARLVLDYINNTSLYINHLQYLAEIAYWEKSEDWETALEWYEAGVKNAETVPQRLRLQSQLADFYYQTGDRETALKAYQKALHFDRKNSYIWHQLSRIYFEENDLDKAHDTNLMALKLQPDFKSAQKMQQIIQKKQGGLLGRFFSR